MVRAEQERPRGFSRLYGDRHCGRLRRSYPDRQGAVTAALPKDHDVLALPGVLPLTPADLRDGDFCPAHCIGGAHHLSFFLVDHVGQPRGQRSPALMQSSLDGADGDIQLCCHLAVAKALKVKEPDRVPLASGQARDSTANTRREISDLRGFCRARRFRHRVKLQAQNLRAELPQPPARQIEGDTAKPAAGPIRRSQPHQVGHRSDRRFLRSIAAQLNRAKDPGRKKHRCIPVTPQQLADRLPRSRESLPHQISIRLREPGTCHAL